MPAAGWNEVTTRTALPSSVTRILSLLPVFAGMCSEWARWHACICVKDVRSNLHAIPMRGE